MFAERGDECLVGCIDLEKAYDRVDRRKLFEVLERMGMNGQLLRLIQNAYEENEVRFELGKLRTGWVMSEAG